MSYDLHIVRGPEWFDDSTHQVSADEWIAYIEGDPDLQRINTDNAHSIAAKLVSSTDDDDGQMLSLSSGSISSSYPQPLLLAKMFQVAKHFAAYVVSDDGEIYELGANGKIHIAEQ
jgi:hypothetical protein